MASRIARLPQQEWVYGRSNANIVMAAFLHVGPAGTRFNSCELGAWYAAAEIETAAAEVAHHLRRQAVARSIPEISRVYRSYSARLDGIYLDIRGQQAERPDIYASDRYDASQRLGESVRDSDSAGIVYNSVRRRDGINIVAYRPTNILDIVQADHFTIRVLATERRIIVQKLTAHPQD
ncbi:RES family NAD+ phosphorylase [Microvirga roseola]|uniref:RES family NAD+ phosphorylase n=1 Tax=Microvirga roseola TaxID=2883126 RepID=UPI001E351D20|nr:RES family NAD+ phosphorylase [Microvirga roseola]